ncbi:helix-turn-helix domain-containing protein [Nocardia sp. NBC_01503]|uniref:helix-turn-helix domain-containing protein n=1 Tax=Nocardia sp. NBC_01503 TaxID=2975997 RepID=UPI002E7AFF77|nr:helix-turn-helix transcriptional regulator [Nocardia sp. NBC_01503]WTL29124.1 helix-turn-helix domain-containing protein [Nocardia sp. NBC_01503]
MPSVGQTLPLHQLGRRLRDWRDGAGYSLERAASMVPGMSQTALHRLEKGMKAKPNPRDVRAICELYGVPEDLIDGAVGLAMQAAQKDWWWHAYGGDIPEDFDVYVAQETAAESICSHQPNLIPGLLQTPSYVLSLARESLPDAEPQKLERIVEVKTHRKAILTRPKPVVMDVVISQAALHHRVGSAAIMAAQLRHLTEMTALHPNITLQVLPFEAGFPGGVSMPPFVILDFGRASDGSPIEPRTIFLENVVGGIYLRKPDDVSFYDRAYDRIKQASLDAKASQTLVTRVAKEYDRE